MDRWRLLVIFEGRHSRLRILAKTARDAVEQYLAAGGLCVGIFGGAAMRERNILLWAPLNYEATVFLCFAGQADSYASITVTRDSTRQPAAEQTREVQGWKI